MIFTLGYRDIHDADQLAGLASYWDAKVVDVRARPCRSRSGFGHRQLAERLTSTIGPFHKRHRYEARPKLCGRDKTSLGPQSYAKAIRKLAADFRNEVAIVMCACAAVSVRTCHRSDDIAARITWDGEPVYHMIFDEDLDRDGLCFVEASDLQRHVELDAAGVISSKRMDDALTKARSQQNQESVNRFGLAVTTHLLLID